MELLAWPLLRIRCIRNSFADPTATFFDLGAVTLSFHQFSLLRAGSRGKPTASLRCGRHSLLSPKDQLFGELCRKALSGYLPVHALAAGVGDRHREAARDMGERHGRGDLVHMLASRP